MPSGGKRSNAGRKKGVGNRITEEARREAVTTGETPLQYMLRVMRDPKAKLPRRDDMARAAAPYIHPKLSSTEISGKEGGEPVRFVIEGFTPKKDAK